jgi:ubiquinone/menaquinone biosynthesis C-methylase UbiE
MHTPKSVKAFGAEHAKSYDREAELLMGSRDRQRRYLSDLLQCLPREPSTFVELACGTGYFTEVFFETLPGIRGVAIDGSEDMLEQARARFNDTSHDLTLRWELLQTFDWSSVGTTALVFSAFGFHHFSYDEKRNLLRKIFEYLDPGGSFVLFDLFRPEDSRADALVGRMAGLEIQRRVEVAGETAPPLERIIARDRESKDAHGVQEASVETHTHWLRETGFESVVPIFLDARMGGIVAFKPE